MTPPRAVADCHLYLCTPDRPDLTEFVDACLRGGVDIVQLRDKELEPRPLLARAHLVRAVCAEHHVPFILNDRPELALEAGADGVHVGQEDAPVSLARRVLGADAVIGLSTHSEEDLAAALEQDVSYLSAGPVEPTPTKPGRPGTGIDYLRRAVERSPVPVFVTGGVTPERIGDLAGAGARHFVVVRYLTGADDAAEAARRLRGAIGDAVGL